MTYSDEQVVAALAAYYDDEERAFSESSIRAMRRALEAAEPPRVYEYAHKVFGELHVNSEGYVRAMHERHGDDMLRRSVGAWENLNG